MPRHHGIKFCPKPAQAAQKAPAEVSKAAVIALCQCRSCTAWACIDSFIVLSPWSRGKGSAESTCRSCKGCWHGPVPLQKLHWQIGIILQLEFITKTWIHGTKRRARELERTAASFTLSRLKICFLMCCIDTMSLMELTAPAWERTLKTHREKCIMTIDYRLDSNTKSSAGTSSFPLRHVEWPAVDSEFLQPDITPRAGRCKSLPAAASLCRCLHYRDSLSARLLMAGTRNRHLAIYKVVWTLNWTPIMIMTVTHGHWVPSPRDFKLVIIIRIKT